METIIYKQIERELARIFTNAGRTAQYNSKNEFYRPFGGWRTNGNTPISRPSFIKEFGVETIEKAEAGARAKLEDARKRYFFSEWSGWKRQADNHCGNHMWVVGTACKADGLKSELREMLDGNARACKFLAEIERTVHVTDLFTCDFDEYIKKYEIKGGTLSETDELMTLIAPYPLHCTRVAQFIDEKGRSCYADPSGFSYARYIYFNQSWFSEFAGVIGQLKREKEEKERREKEEQENESNKEMQAYTARCKKWEKYMKPVANLELAAKQAKTKEEKKAAERILQNTRRANIVAMLKAAFPGKKISVKKSDAWGCSWVVTYTDGVTVKQLKEKTDLDLFQTYEDVFYGQEDYADVKYKKNGLCSFAKSYIGTTGTGGIEIKREMSEKVHEQLKAKVLAAVPELANNVCYRTDGLPDNVRNKIYDLCSSALKSRIWINCESAIKEIFEKSEF